MIEYDESLMYHSPLIDDYRLACKRVYGIPMAVSKKDFCRFAVLEYDLKSLGADMGHYTDTITVALKGWTRQRGMKCLPARVFCSDFAVGKYLRIADYQTVDIIREDHAEELLYTELLVQRDWLMENMRGNAIRLCELIELLRPVLSPRWLMAYDDNSCNRPKRKATDILADEYGVMSYRHIGDVLQYAMERYGQVPIP